MSGLQGPHFKHLTDSYVKALGLEPFLYWHRESYAVWVPEPVQMRGADFAVVYNHALYLRSLDGLSWDLKL